MFERKEAKREKKIRKENVNFGEDTGEGEEESLKNQMRAQEFCGERVREKGRDRMCVRI